MWLLHIKREKLLETLHLAISGNIPDLKKFQSLGPRLEFSSELYLIWEKYPKTDLSLPVIVIKDGTKRDFLAWIVTYFPSLYPITRDCRVLEHSTFVSYLQRKNIKKVPTRYLTAIVGLIISEATFNNASNNIERSITFRDCLETFSFSFGRALSTGASIDELSTIQNMWDKVQKNSNRKHFLPKDVISHNSPWSLILQLHCENFFFEDYRSNDTDIFKFAKAFMKNKDISQKMLNDILESLQISKKALELTSEGSRESRVIALEEIYSKLGRNNLSKSSLAQCISGFLINQIEPGTLNYFPLLISDNKISNEVGIWYGFWAGLHPCTKIFLSESGLGWSVASELTRKENIFDCQSVDMDVDELEMFIDSKSKLPTNKTRRAGSLTVELMPMVKTLLALGTYDPKRKPVQQSMFGQELSTQEVKRISEDFDNVMLQMNYLKNSFKKITSPASSNKHPYRKRKE